MLTRIYAFIRMDEIVKKRKEEDDNLAKKLPPPPSKVARLSIVAMVVILVALLTVSTWYFIFSIPRRAVTRLTKSIRKEILDSTVGFLDEIFRWNAYGAKALVGMLEKDLLGDGASLESFSKIRAAAWSLFNAIPVITSIGVTSSNGLTGLYVRGGLHPGDSEAGRTGPIFLYTKSTEEYSPLYIENVNSSTGEAIEDPMEYYFKVHFKDRDWFRYALSVPIGETAWHLEKSQMGLDDVDLAGGRPYVQCGIPILCSKVKQVAVVHSSHSAQAITEYLSSTPDLKGGNVFVVNAEGEVLFSSESQCINRNVTGCKVHSEVEEAVKLIETKTHLKELVKEEIHYTDAVIHGRLYFIDSWYDSFQGLKLAVVIMVPRQSFWGPMDTHTQFARVTIPSLALCISFVGCRLIYLLMQQVSADTNLRTELLSQLEARRRAEASRDAKTAFLSHMSHELRTPMACIIGLLEILMGELKLSEHESSVRQVHRCATSLVTLLNSALDIAKVEAGKLELENAEFDLETELSSLIDIFSVQCDAKGLHLALQLSDDIPKLVSGDAARVMQIFTNLIGNSIKFTPKGRIVVRGWVDVKEPESGGGATLRDTGESDENQLVMMFEVDDTGPGIDKALRERVFENFVQGDVSTPRTHGGTGLGLGIVRSLVHLMGGAIRIGDKTGEGTVFQFSLCFGLPSEQKIIESVVKSRQIILGMSEKDCRAVVAHWLEDRGLSVHQAGSWEDVLIHLKALPLPLCGKRIEENSDQTFQEEDMRRGKMYKDQSTCRQCGDGPGAIRRSKSDSTSNGRVEKPVLIVDVDLLPQCLDKRDHLQAFEKLGFALKNHNRQGPSCKSLDFHALVWVTASNTPVAFKRVLRLLCRSVLVRRPLHASRLRDLFHQLETREQEFRQLDGIAENPVPSTLSVKIAKQLGELYTGDEAACCSDGIIQGGSANPCTPCNGLGDEVSPILEADSNKNLPPISQGAPSNSLVRSKSDNVAKLVRIPRSKPAARALEKLEILVAEDHPLLRRLASTMLKKLGATPYEACNGQESVSSVITRFENGQPPFHCILMDCQMPIMDGYDASKAVREFELGKNQHTCIIALTANAMATDEQRCFNVGMDAFLSKPIQQDHLVRVILSTMASQTQETGLPVKTPENG